MHVIIKKRRERKGILDMICFDKRPDLHKLTVMLKSCICENLPIQKYRLL